VLFVKRKKHILFLFIVCILFDVPCGIGLKNNSILSRLCVFVYTMSMHVVGFFEM